MRFYGFVFAGLMVTAPRLASASSDPFTPDLKQCQTMEEFTNVCCVSEDPTSCMNNAQKREKAKLEQLVADKASRVEIQKASIKVNAIHLDICHQAIKHCTGSCQGLDAMINKCRNYSERLHYFRDQMKPQPTPTADDRLRAIPVRSDSSGGGATAAPEDL